MEILVQKPLANRHSASLGGAGRIVFVQVLIVALSAGLAMAQPVFTSAGVVNATGYQNTLAPDTVFVIFGTAMGPATLVAATGPNYPTSLSGTSITFTPASGGATISAEMVYSSAGQVAGFLPSSIAPGTYAVRVTYNSQTSPPQNVTVVARSFGIATANSAGTGPAQATIGNLNGGLSLVRFTVGTLNSGLNWALSPAHPGDTLVLWGTGGGADPKNDTGGTSGDQTAAGNFSVNIAGSQITPLYSGASSGYPGMWQINFTLPSNIPTDCFASVQVSAGGQLSNAVTIAIAPAGQDTCSSPGFSSSAISKLGSGKNITDAVLSVGITTNTIAGTKTVTEVVGALFEVYSASEFLTPFAGPTVGPCHIFQESFTPGGKIPNVQDSYLDAGIVTISGSGIPGGKQAVGMGSTPAPGPTGKYYYSAFPSGTIVTGGTYMITGSGGADVAAFSVTQTVPPNFDVTNLSSLTTINRSQPTTVNWTGGGSGSVVITVQTLKYNATLTNANEAFVACAVPASAGSFTLPSAALAYLPPVAPGGSDFASITVSVSQAVTASVTGVSVAVQQFLPNLTAGGTTDFGAFSGVIAIGQSIAIQ